jgi:hypothetical protein
MSDFAFHPTAAIFGEADALLSMIASRPPIALRLAQSVNNVNGRATRALWAAIRRIVIDQSDPLAMLAAKMNGGL